MHQGLYKQIEKLITRLFSLWVKPDVLPENPASLISDDTPVLYLLETGGLADRAALNLVCAKYQLPNPARELHYGNAKESSSVNVLKRRQGIIFRRHRLVRSRRLQQLVNNHIENDAGELHIVPVAIYWGRAPGKEKSVWSLFFSENWQIGGRTRKLITSLLYGRDTLLSFSEPLSLNTLVHGDASATKKPASHTALSPELIQRKLSRILRVHFRQRRIASLGPDQSHRRMLIDHVMSDPVVKQAISQTATADSKKIERVTAKAHSYAMEIAADISYPTVRVLHRLMNRLWTRLYDGVELNGIERLKSVADGREIVYVPCHRSHIDYLLLSYILYINGFSLPHIAAGVNLNLPVVGSLLRRGGAFFLRRSFAGNPLYAAVFNAYLKEIVERGHAIEYFVEGGRSRTGRLLPPKGGMLAMTAHAYLRNPTTPVVFIPVYFGYERLLEGRAFTSELAGGKKQKESIFGLIKSLRTLREEYGNVYVNFGQAIELNPILDEHHAQWRVETIGAERPDWLKPIVNDLGVSIMQNINDAVCITPISLLAMGLLSTPYGRSGKTELIELMDIYKQLFENASDSSTAVIPTIDFDAAITHGEKLGFVQSAQDPLGTLISIKPGMAAPLTYFRNNVQHAITLPALIACCFSGRNAYRTNEIKQLVQYAYPFLQNELFLPANTSDTAVENALDSLTKVKLIRRHEERWQRPAAGSNEALSLIRLAETVMPALERYYLAAAVLVEAGSDGLEISEMAQQCEACSERITLTHGREKGDLYDKHLHSSLIKTLENSQLADLSGARITATNRLLLMASETKSMVSENIKHAILHAVANYNGSFSDTSA